MSSLAVGKVVGVLVVAAGLLGVRPGSAQDTNEIAKVQAARDLADEGYDLFEQGRYEEALDRLERAFELVEAPTIKLLEAETLLRLGRLIQAREAYETVRRMRLEPDASPAFHAAQKQAAEALTKLKPKIPGITVVLEGAPVEGLTVTIDEQPLEAVAIGVRWPVDPGRHVVEVSSDAGTIARREIDANIGEHERVVVVLATTSKPGGRDAPTDRVSYRAYRLATWTSFGLGGAGLAIGVGAGAVMLSKKATLDDECRDVCPSDAREDYDAFRRARSASWVGYGVGLAGAAAGTTLVLIQPRGEKHAVSSGVRVRPVIGIGAVGMAGSF